MKAIPLMKETPPVELRAAVRRVGDGFNARARWLAAFLNADMTPSKPEEIERWAWEMMYYLLTDKISWQATGATLATMSSRRTPETVGKVRRQVYKLWKTTRQSVASLLDPAEGEALLPLSNDGAISMRRHADGRISEQIAGELTVAFPRIVANTLTTLGPKLHRCDPDVCPAFVAAVGHLKYHSTRCAQRAGMRKLRVQRRDERRKLRTTVATLGVAPS